MPEQLQAFLAWYLAPWRRIGRKEFAIALTVATVPGLILMVVGLGDSAGHFFGPLMNLANMGQGMDAAVNSGDVAALQGHMNSMGNSFSSFGNLLGGGQAEQAFHVDWSGAFNNVLLLALLPLTRMRLRDMGWFGKQELALTLAFNLSVFGSLVDSLTGWNPLPMASLFGILNFGGYMWLSMAKGKAYTAVSERTDYTRSVTQDPTRMDRDDDRY